MQKLHIKSVTPSRYASFFFVFQSNLNHVHNLIYKKAFHRMHNKYVWSKTLITYTVMYTYIHTYVCVCV